MKKRIRATYIAARLINSRPDFESYEAFSRRVGLPFTMTVDSLTKRKDITVGLLYRICKVFGYQIIVYNPKPPQGLDSMYVIGTAKSPIAPRELKGSYHVRRDAYTGEIFRTVRQYRKKKKRKKFIKVDVCRKVE